MKIHFDEIHELKHGAYALVVNILLTTDEA